LGGKLRRDNKLARSASKLSKSLVDLFSSPPGVDFTNIFRAAFASADPKRSKKKQSGHLCLFALLGSSGVKSAHKTLMKLTIGLTPLAEFMDTHL